ncbi:MAG: hypothetical protein U5L09_03265, partial [Bacteroidales bacterium]|nr:hypothetical protein [Bacteroidales bacterium]
FILPETSLLKASFKAMKYSTGSYAAKKPLEAKKVLLKLIYTKKRLQVNHQRMVWTKAFRDDMEQAPRRRRHTRA